MNFVWQSETMDGGSYTNRSLVRAYRSLALSWSRLTLPRAIVERQGEMIVWVPSHTTAQLPGDPTPMTGDPAQPTRPISSGTTGTSGTEMEQDCSFCAPCRCDDECD